MAWSILTAGPPNIGQDFGATFGKHCTLLRQLIEHCIHNAKNTILRHATCRMVSKGICMYLELMAAPNVDHTSGMAIGADEVHVGIMAAVERNVTQLKSRAHAEELLGADTFSPPKNNWHPRCSV